MPNNREGLPDPRPYPDRPARLAAGPVRRFLRDCERAFVHNRELGGNGYLERLTVDVTDMTVDSIERGLVGTVRDVRIIHRQDLPEGLRNRYTDADPTL